MADEEIGTDTETIVTAPATPAQAVSSVPIGGFEVIVKGFCSIAIGILGAVLTSPTIRQSLGDLRAEWIGVSIVGLTILQNYLTSTYSNYKRQKDITK